MTEALVAVPEQTISEVLGNTHYEGRIRVIDIWSEVEYMEGE